MNETIVINGIEYVPKSKKQEGLKYVIVRTYSAGVHAGYLKEKDGKYIVLINTRRIWYWSGACSLSQLSKDGTNDKDNCKFSCEIEEITLTEAIEIIPCTDKAKKSIDEVPEWKK